MNLKENNKIKRKYILYITIAIAVISSTILLLRCVNSIKTNIETQKREEEQLKEEIKRKEEEAKKEAEKKIFNAKFERQSGTSSKTSVEWTIDDVITNNKSNKEHPIEVVYNNERYGTSADEIIKIKTKLVNFKDFNIVNYEVLFDYDDDGYIYKMIIKG